MAWNICIFLRVTKMQKPQHSTASVVLYLHQQRAARTKYDSGRDNLYLDLRKLTGHNLIDAPDLRFIFVSQRKMQREINPTVKPDFFNAIV